MEAEMKRIPQTLLLSPTHPPSIFVKCLAQKSHVIGKRYLLGKGSLAGFSLTENGELEKFKNRPC